MTCYPTGWDNPRGPGNHIGIADCGCRPDRGLRSQCSHGSFRFVADANQLAQDPARAICPQNWGQIVFAAGRGHIQRKWGPWLQHETGIGSSFYGLGWQRSPRSRGCEWPGFMQVIGALVTSRRKVLNPNAFGYLSVSWVPSRHPKQSSMNLNVIFYLTAR